MIRTDDERDELISRVLEDSRQAGATLRDVDTLENAPREILPEVRRLATVEDALHATIDDWKRVGGDETLSAAFGGGNTAAESDAKLAIAAFPPTVGRYCITGQLGEGGMGTVLAADDPQLQRRVAVKLPHFSGSPDRQAHARKRFLREARSAAPIQHANVCPIYDVGEHEGKPFVVMALIEGEALNQRLHHKPRLTSRESAALIAKVARGLSAVHAHGVIHRDLKPGNILLRRKDGEPILTDFGLAHVSEDGEQLTADGTILGTPAYMAPEQADPQLGPVTARSDLYSLGVILFEMVAGRRPFEGTMSQIMGQLSSTPAPRASQVFTDIDPGLDALIARALARKAEDRFADAESFAAALEAWLQDPSATVTYLRERASQTIEMPKRKRRRRALIVGGCAAAVSAIVALTVIWMRNDRRPEPDKVPEPPIVAGGDKTKPESGQTTAKTPVTANLGLDGHIDVAVWHKGEFDPVSGETQHGGLKLKDAGALPLSPGDWLKIEVKLNRPAYCYIVWIDTEGKVTPFHPWIDGDWNRWPANEVPIQSIFFPEGGNKLAQLDVGPAGMETIMLLARDEQLPRHVELDKFFTGLPVPTTADLRAAAWFKRGKLVTKEQEVDRGPIRLDQAQAVRNPVVETQALLQSRLSNLFPYTRAASFSNRGDR